MSPTQSFAVVSDIDGTLLGDDASLADLAQWFASKRDRVRLILASGRFFDSVCESVRTTDIPNPDVVIGGVGTEIRTYPTGEPVDGWTETLADRWDAQKVRQCLQSQPDLILQPEEFLSEWKVSYYAHNVPPERIAEWNRLLTEQGVTAKIIYSSQRDLDVLPAAASKGCAARFLVRKWGIPNERVIVCGDSGNDLSMYQEGFRGVVVGNGHPELKALAGPNAYIASRPFAGGVLEGLSRWIS